MGTVAHILPLPEADEDTSRRIVAHVLGPEFAFPTLPGTAAEVMHLANLSEVDFRRVDSVVRRDPILAARVLSVANSPVYSSGRDVMSLRTAMMRLGWRTLREVLWQVVAEAHIFRGQNRSLIKRQRLHAVAIAHVARMMRIELDVDAEDAFVCGLLHDVGEVLTHHVLIGDLGEGLEPEARADLVTRLHTSVGRRLAASWALPDAVVESIEHHHAFENADGAGDIAETPVHTRLVAGAEIVARHLGLAAEQVAYDPQNEAEAKVLASLGVDEAAVEPLMERCEALQSQLL